MTTRPTYRLPVKFTVYIQADRPTPCKWCDAAVKLLENAGHPYEKIALPKDELLKVAAYANHPSIPIIFAGGLKVGGFDELKTYLENATTLEEAHRLFQLRRGAENPCAVPMKRLTPSAILPTYGSAGAAGMDLYADLLGKDDIIIYNGERKLIPTGWSMAIPLGLYGQIAPRSGHAFKAGIQVMAGIVDNDYRKEVGVILYNTDREPFVVDHGLRVAQFILKRYAPGFAYEADVLPETSRSGGWGSTGTH